MGKNLWDSSLVPYHLEADFWLANTKKPGKIVGELENYDFRNRYIKREYMWIIIILVSNNVPPILKVIFASDVAIENFRTRHSSEIASQFPRCARKKVNP
jgi:hypothetical protein